MRLILVSTFALVGFFSVFQESETSEYQQLITPEQHTADSFLRKQKREDKLNGILVASLTTDNIDDMLIATKRLKDASFGNLPHQLVVRLFAKQKTMNKEQTTLTLALLRGNMSKAYLELLIPLLLSDENGIAEQAYLLLSELPYNYQTRHIYLQLSHSSKSKQVRSAVRTIISQQTS